MSGSLYIVATPIGNSEDITERAKRILNEVDIVAAEDTRTAKKLFNILGIDNKTVSYHKFNERRQADYLVSELLAGKNIALVSDAGTPCISDPGHFIVSAAVENGVDVVGVSGASSVVTALSITGFNFTSFAFHGFFPREAKPLREILRKIGESDIKVHVFFESPRRILKLIGIMAEETPDFGLCVCNDMTKLHERIYRGLPGAVLNELEDNPNHEKGEYTIVINTPPVQETCCGKQEPGMGSLESLIIDHIVSHGGSVKLAIRALHEKYRGEIAKKEFYKASLNLRRVVAGLLPLGGDEAGEAGEANEADEADEADESGKIDSDQA